MAKSSSSENSGIFVMGKRVSLFLEKSLFRVSLFRAGLLITSLTNRAVPFRPENLAGLGRAVTARNLAGPGRAVRAKNYGQILEWAQYLLSLRKKVMP